MLEATFVAAYPTLAFIGEVVVFWIVWKTLDFFFHHKIEAYRVYLAEQKEQRRLAILEDRRRRKEDPNYRPYDWHYSFYN